MYWDGESTPSVETPVGDFFGLGLGEYHLYQSLPLAVGSDKALNSFFQMPSRNTRASRSRTRALAELTRSISTSTTVRTTSLCRWICFISTPSTGRPRRSGLTNDWHSNGDPLVNGKKNLNGEGNYVWLEATGRGHFVGVTMSVLENQDGWWGEGDDMFFVDGESTPSINGTGSEDYFLGAWDFGGHAFSYGLFGAPVVGEALAGGRWSLFGFTWIRRFRLESLRATIEHGHANHRSDNYFSVAYWYQTGPHAAFPGAAATGAADSEESIRLVGPGMRESRRNKKCGHGFTRIYTDNMYRFLEDLLHR